MPRPLRQKFVSEDGTRLLPLATAILQRVSGCRKQRKGCLLLKMSYAGNGTRRRGIELFGKRQSWTEKRLNKSESRNQEAAARSRRRILFAYYQAFRSRQ